jgi:hypothetical protein
LLGLASCVFGLVSDLCSKSAKKVSKGIKKYAIFANFCKKVVNFCSKPVHFCKFFVFFFAPHPCFSLKNKCSQVISTAVFFKFRALGSSILPANKKGLPKKAGLLSQVQLST